MPLALLRRSPAASETRLGALARSRRECGNRVGENSCLFSVAQPVHCTHARPVHILRIHRTMNPSLDFQGIHCVQGKSPIARQQQLESNPLKSRFVVRGLAVPVQPVHLHVRSARLLANPPLIRDRDRARARGPRYLIDGFIYNLKL